MQALLLFQTMKKPLSSGAFFSFTGSFTKNRHGNNYKGTFSRFNTFTINGKLHYDFFDTDTKAAFEENSTEYSLWHDVKPYCFSIIRGRRTPLNFRIVFELSHDQTQSLLKNEQHIADIPVQSFYLNIRYKNQSLLCTTGVSYTSFSPDKRLEHLWDDSMTVFLSSHHIPCEKL